MRRSVTVGPPANHVFLERALVGRTHRRGRSSCAAMSSSRTSGR